MLWLKLQKATSRNNISFSRRHYFHHSGQRKPTAVANSIDMPLVIPIVYKRKFRHLSTGKKLLDFYLTADFS
jgi:hypothetical protein